MDSKRLDAFHSFQYWLVSAYSEAGILAIDGIAKVF